jgi:hypothetical protein
MKMKQLVIISLAVLVMSTMALAQGRGTGWRYRAIQTQSPVMIEGTIVKIETLDWGKGRYGKGIHLMVRAKDRESEIHLGPQAWWSEQGLPLQQGDTVKIKAFKATLNNGNTALLAAELSNAAQGKSIILRDAYGFPLWRQSLRRGRGMGRGYGRGPAPTNASSQNR